MEKIYTYSQWWKDRDLKVEVGQYIDRRVYYQLLECMPPTTYGGEIFQPGEPYSHDWNTGQALYKTFEYDKSEKLYKYIGLRPAYPYET